MPITDNAGVAVRRRLHNFEGRTTLPLHGTGAILFGLLFAAAGSIPLAIGAAMIYVGSGETSPPGWVVAAAGAVFVVAGLGALVSGLRGTYGRWRARRAVAAGATAPWDWDHPWNRRGARDDLRFRVVRRIGFMAFIVLFLAPFHYLVLTVEETVFRVIGGLFMVVFDVVIALQIVEVAKMLLRRLRYGSVWLEFEQFPLPLGRSAGLRLILGRHVDAASVACTLRCVEEAVEISHQRPGRTTHTYVFDQLYEQRIVAPLAPGPDGRQTARVTFLLPDGDLSTRLSAEPPRYWLLEAEATAPGVDLSTRFLLPVYAVDGTR
jgi:hypothetical protein